MRIEFVALSQLNRAIYDEYVACHSGASAYHFSAWLVCVYEAYKHDAIIALAYEDNTLVGVAPLVLFSRFWGKPSFCALPYCDVGHVLADSDDIKHELIKNICEYGASHLISSFVHRDICSGNDNQDDDALTGKKVAMKMPLQSSASEQMASYKSKLRSQIRKAEKNGLSIKLTEGNDLLDDFYHVIAQNMRELGSPVHKKSWYEAIVKHYQGRLCMGVVYDGDMTIGAGLVLLHPHQCSIPWASTLAKYNRLAPNMMLYGALIGYAADKQIPVFDFGRSTFNEGTYRFKKQWGARPHALDWQDCFVSSPRAKNTETSDEKFKQLAVKVWQQLPLSMTTLVGSRVRGLISL